MNLSGTWTGEYSDDFGTHPIDFTLTLNQRWLFRLREVVLDGVGGMPEDGLVEGWTCGTRIRFRKLMPIARVVVDGGTRTLREQLALRDGEILAGDPPHPPILYEGRVSSDGRSAAGTWRIAVHHVPLADGERSLRMGGITGTWKARRAG